MKLFFKTGLIVLILLGSACQQPIDSVDYRITFDAELLPNGTKVMVADYAELLHEGLLSEEPLVFSGSTEQWKLVRLQVENKAHRMWFVERFILEPGNTLIRFTRSGAGAARPEFVIEGGPTNALVFNSWALNAEYQQISAEEEQYFNNNPGDLNDENIREAFRAFSQRKAAARSEILGRVIGEATDPRIRALAIGMGYNVPLKERKALLAEIVEQAPEFQEGRDLYAQISRMVDTEDALASVGKGKPVKPFTTQTIDGEVYDLRDAFDGNRYVLIEFWASWCGPCRLEIPNMKVGYEKYRDRGFEIVSYSVDTEMEDWREASTEEQLPWIDTGDLLNVFDSPVTKEYGISGIPMNFLVDTSTETIVATKLIGDDFHTKLEELFGDD